MSNNNNMNRLRNRIVKYFAVMTFIIALLESILDSTWNDIVCPKLYPDYDPPLTEIPSILYLLTSFMMYIVGGIIFYKLTKKAIRKETDRQVKEQNMIYAAIAHDLKTPMTSIQGFAKALADGKIRPDERQEIYDIIYTKCRSMDSLISTMSEYANFGAGCEPKSEKINLSELLRSVVAEIYCDFEEHNIGLDVDIPEEEIITVGDEAELRRALMNLAVNIFKHNPDGIRAKISLERGDGSAIVTFADSGEAIPEDMNIFEPFVTSNVSRTSGGGTGLGLAIVKKIIELHGGKISVSESSSDYTKEFVVNLKI